MGSLNIFSNICLLL